MKIRRDYNTWVANETMEDYALRYTARASRKWSEFRVANTAFGAISFLALEAIGASIMLNYGFTTAFFAIVAVSTLIFITALPISWYAARYGVDMDLLTRGAGFGYIGSTITSLIYASFTFIFFALEATIMAQALKLIFHLPLAAGYVISALVIIPLVTYGISWISRLQAWTQPLWLALMFLPFTFLLAKQPELLRQITSFAGMSGESGFNLMLFGAACGVLMAMVVQVGEQVDFLRFLPERSAHNRRRWLAGLLLAGPGWIGLGGLKMLGGALLAFAALQVEIPASRAVEPTEMYLIGFKAVFASPQLALAVTALFVVLSQIKINVTNAYAGSLAWSNFFARLTHSHPGRVVWLVFNVLIALLLMQLNVFHLLEQVLGLYANVAISWVGALVADLLVNKPLGLSPRGIEFRRAYLYDINPVGVGAMLIASLLSIGAFSGLFGAVAQAFSSFVALIVAFATAPLLAWLTQGRYYLARQPPAPARTPQRCCVCENRYEAEDMAMCPAYGGPICSLCCALDVRCHDQCKPGASLADQALATLRWLLPQPVSTRLNTRLGHYLLVVLAVAVSLAAILGLVYSHQLAQIGGGGTAALRSSFFEIFGVLLLVGGIGSWWLVLTAESRRVAQEESNRQTHLLMQEIDAHQRTDAALQKAKLAAERANAAKSRYVTGISHELRTPLNSILGYAQILEYQSVLSLAQRDAVNVIRRSGEHLTSLIDGLLDLARIESGKLALETDELRFRAFVTQIAGMFRLQAHSKGLQFSFEEQGRLPDAVRADKKRLGQILINILGNAIKFTSHGQVSLRVRYGREIAVFEVQDSGIGISARDMQRIFLPFERGANAGQSADGGTGLGLTIAKLLTEMMGGELTADSQPGVGSRFSLRLFLPELHHPMPHVQLPSLDVSGYAGPRRRVLIVDNEPADRELLARVLEPLGFEVTKAASGIEALRLVAIVAPDLILLDIGMPGLDGWETARLLRSNRLSEAPVLVVSADAFKQQPPEGCGIELQDILLKPVDVLDLLARIRRKLDLQWLQPQAAAPAPPRRPPEACLQVLREQVRLGDLQAIAERLDALERSEPLYGPYTDELRRCLRAFELDELARLLQADASLHASENGATT